MVIAMIVYNRKSNFNIIFLGLLIVAYITGVVTYYFLAFEQSRFWIAVFYTNLAPLWYLPGPLLYFYVRGSILDTAVLRKWDYLHFIPFLVALVGVAPYLFSSFDYKLRVAEAIMANLNNAKDIRTNWILPYETNMLLRPILICAYCIVCIGMIFRAQTSFTQSSPLPLHRWTFFRNWLLFLSGLILLFTLPSFLITSSFTPDYNAGKGGVIDIFFSFVLGVPLFIFPAVLVSFPQILYGIPQFRGSSTSLAVGPRPIIDVAENEIQVTKKEGTVRSDEYQLTEDPFAELADLVLKVMAEKQPYLSLDFSLEDLAELLQVPKHHLYYCFQNHLHTKFTRLRTKFRVEHAKQLLTELDLGQITIDAVGRNSGFASKTNFYTIFKAEVGISPGEFAQANNRLGYKGSE
jgi:AraC-like DNA-binding protein